MGINFGRLLAAADGAPLDWGMIWSTVITGITVVFIILIILIVFLIIFGKIFKAINKAVERREALKVEGIVVPHSFRLQRTADDTQKPEATAPGVIDEPDDEEWEEEDDSEIIAVIAAAIAAYGEAQGKQYRVASVKRQKTRRSGWSSAGIADNMRGFMN